MKNKIKLIRTIVIILSVIVVGLIGCLVTMVKDVEVVNSTHYSYEEIKEYMMDESFEKNAIFLYLKNRYSEQEKIPFVEYVDVELKGINKIKLTVYDKKIVGCISYMNKYIYFDKDGYFVEQSTEKLEDVPYVTGIEFNEIKLYEQMKVDKEEIFNVVMNITKLINKYEISVNEIQFNRFSELTLYSDEIEILLGKHTTYDEQIAKLSGILKEAKGMKGILHLENYSSGSSNIIFEKK